MFTRAIVRDDSEVRGNVFALDVSFARKLSLSLSLSAIPIPLLCFANTRHKYSPRCLPRAHRIPFPLLFLRFSFERSKLPFENGFQPR